jgi:hypothetical protein
MEWRQRAARNEEIHRSVNERIDETARRHALDQELAFHCECDDPECFVRLTLAASEYDAIAADVSRFIVAPGHEDTEIEKVVKRSDQYVIVEKIGAAREQIERDHPRDRHSGDAG